MNVPRRTLYAGFIAAVATAVSIQLFPDIDFVSYALPVVEAGVIACLLLAAVSFYREDDLTMHDKNVLMNAFLVAVLVPSFYTAGAFVHQSQTSWSGGEIHYHADYEVLVEQDGELRALDLIDPSNFCGSDYMCTLNDRTGITEYHEHNDNRIHLEGVFETRSEATLAAFFETFGGELSNTRLVYPTNEEVVEVEENGGNLKVIVRRGTGGNRHWCVIGDDVSRDETCVNQYTGELATSPSGYIVSPYKKGPSLDDIFVIYDSRSTQAALQDLREDGKYRGMGISKEGEGF